MLNAQDLADKINAIEKDRESLYPVDDTVDVICILIDFQTHDHPEVHVAPIEKLFEPSQISFESRGGNREKYPWRAFAFVDGVEFFECVTNAHRKRIESA